MSTAIPLQQRVDDDLSERRRLGFELRPLHGLLTDFATFVAERRHDGPLSIELMVEWAREGKGGRGTRETRDRRMANLRPFLRYLHQFEPHTEIPEETLFGPEPGRVAPHIYREEEIVALLVATRTLGRPGCLRAATYETLFGLMAATGLRVSEAIHLRDADVDLKRGLLTVRESKFRKSRQVPLHPGTVDALTRFRKRRRREIPATPDPAFFTGSRGSLPGQPLGERQVHRVFSQLREQLHWVNRGAHAAPRLHDLRHTFAVRRLIEWQREGCDLDRKMLALSTYLGHANIGCTYWYLSAVPELMAVAGAKFERFAAPEECRDA
jgi:integrase